MKFRTKLIALVLVLSLAICAVLCACNDTEGLFRKNQERVSKQITSDASYGGRVAAVTLNDLYASYYNYYSYLYTYYSNGYIDAATFQSYMNDLDKTFATYNENLAREALYNLKCIEELYSYYKTNCADAEKVKEMENRSTVGVTYNFKDTNGLAKYYKERYEEIKAILSCADDYYYVNKAIYSANSSIQKLYDDYYAEVESEYAALEVNDKEDTTPSGYVGIELTSTPSRLVYEVNDSALNTNGMVVKALYKDADPVVIPNEFLTISGFSASSTADSQEITVSYGKYSKSFNISIIEALPSRPEEATAEEDEDTIIAEETENNTKILNYFSFSVLESSYIKEGQTDAEHKEAIKQYKIANTAMNRVLKYLEENYRSFNYYLYTGFVNQIPSATSDILNKNTIVTKDELETKYEQLTAKELEGYISTPYSKDSVSKETIVNKAYTDTSLDNGGYFYVTQILIKFDSDTLKKAVDFKNEKVSNEQAYNDYLESLLPEVTSYTFNPDYDAKATCENVECDCPRCSNYKGNAHYDFDTIEKWYGLTYDNDYIDPCVNNHTGESTCACVACPTKKYGEKVNAINYIDQISADLDACETIQEKVEKFNEYVYSINTDSGIFSNITDGKLGYVMTPQGISSGMIEEFDSKCRELVATGVGSYGYTIGEYSTDKYGIHFILVTDLVTDQAKGEITPVAEDATYVKLGLDYCTDPFATVEDDEEPVIANGAETIELQAGTIAYYIWQDLYSDDCSTKVAEYKKTFLGEYGKSNINLYPKAYKSTVDDLKDSING